MKVLPVSATIMNEAKKKRTLFSLYKNVSRRNKKEIQKTKSSSYPSSINTRTTDEQKHPRESKKHDAISHGRSLHRSVGPSHPTL
jgi:hypothetical protein